MIKGHDRVVLKSEIQEEGLKAGDVEGFPGTVYFISVRGRQRGRAFQS